MFDNEAKATNRIPPTDVVEEGEPSETGGTEQLFSRFLLAENRSHDVVFQNLATADQWLSQLDVLATNAQVLYKISVHDHNPLDAQPKDFNIDLETFAARAGVLSTIHQQIDELYERIRGAQKAEDLQVLAAELLKREHEYWQAKSQLDADVSATQQRIEQEEIERYDELAELIRQEGERILRSSGVDKGYILTEDGELQPRYAGDARELRFFLGTLEAAHNQFNEKYNLTSVIRRLFPKNTETFGRLHELLKQIEVVGNEKSDFLDRVVSKSRRLARFSFDGQIKAVLRRCRSQVHEDIKQLRNSDTKSEALLEAYVGVRDQLSTAMTNEYQYWLEAKKIGTIKKVTGEDNPDEELVKAFEFFDPGYRDSIVIQREIIRLLQGRALGAWQAEHLEVFNQYNDRLKKIGSPSSSGFISEVDRIIEGHEWDRKVMPKSATVDYVDFFESVFPEYATHITDQLQTTKRQLQHRALPVISEEKRFETDERTYWYEAKDLKTVAERDLAEALENIVSSPDYQQYYPLLFGALKKFGPSYRMQWTDVTKIPKTLGTLTICHAEQPHISEIDGHYKIWHHFIELLRRPNQIKFLSSARTQISRSEDILKERVDFFHLLEQKGDELEELMDQDNPEARMRLYTNILNEFKNDPLIPEVLLRHELTFDVAHKPAVEYFCEKMRDCIDNSELSARGADVPLPEVFDLIENSNQLDESEKAALRAFAQHSPRIATALSFELYERILAGESIDEYMTLISNIKVAEECDQHIALITPLVRFEYQGLNSHYLPLLRLFNLYEDSNERESALAQYWLDNNCQTAAVRALSKDSLKVFFKENKGDDFLASLPAQTDERRNAFTHSKYDRTSQWLIFLSQKTANMRDFKDAKHLAFDFHDDLPIATAFVTEFQLAKNPQLFLIFKALYLADQSESFEVPDSIKALGLTSMENLRTEYQEVQRYLVSPEPLFDLSSWTSFQLMLLSAVAGVDTHAFGEKESIEFIIDRFQRDLSADKIQPLPHEYVPVTISLSDVEVSYKPSAEAQETFAMASDVVDEVFENLENTNYVLGILSEFKVLLETKKQELLALRDTIEENKRKFLNLQIDQIDEQLILVDGATTADEALRSIGTFAPDKQQYELWSLFLHKLVFYQILKKTEGGDGSFQNLAIGVELDADSLKNINDVYGEVVKHHALDFASDRCLQYWSKETRVAFSGKKMRKQLSSMRGVFGSIARIFKDEQQRVKKRSLGSEAQIELVPDGGFTAELSGFFAQACYSAEKSLLANWPVVPYKFIDRSKSPPEIIGTALVFELALDNGEQALLVRPINIPNETEYDVETFCEQFFDQIAGIGKKRGFNKVLVPKKDGAISNSAGIKRYIPAQYCTGKTPVTLSERFAFNGYDLTHDCFVVRSIS